MKWHLVPGVTEAHLGYLPSFFSESDPRPAREQLAENYIGGWDPFKGFTKNADGSLSYPGDPRIYCIATAQLRDEEIRLYQYSWVVIVQADGSWEVSRCD